MTIWFDMDGTIADLYGVEGWLDYLVSEDTTPYEQARALLNLSQLANYLNKLQRKGYELGIVSWTSKAGSELYNSEVALTKLIWLHKHLKSVSWDYIKIVPYGTPKGELCKEGILFDDEKPNRDNWNGAAYDVNDIINTLKKIA